MRNVTCTMRDATRLSSPLEEDRKLRILTQSDPFVSRFVHEVRYVLKRGWYHPVLKGVDPIGKVFMYRVNDYHEVKDVQIPLAYIEEFCQAFAELLDNYSDQNIDVAVLTQINGLGIEEFDEDMIQMFANIGFTRSGDRLIRGGIIQPRPMAEANRVLFEQHNLHQLIYIQNPPPHLSLYLSKHQNCLSKRMYTLHPCLNFQWI